MDMHLQSYGTKIMSELIVRKLHEREKNRETNKDRSR